MTLEHTSRSAPTATPQAVGRWPRRLAFGAIVGPELFTLAWFVLGLVSPGYTVFGTRISPYSPIHQPISGLGLGVTAPYMTAAFIVSGLLLLAGVVGIVQSLPVGGRPVARRASAVLLGLAPLGLVVVGLFNLEHLAMHLLGATLILGTPVISFLVTGTYLRALPGWRRLGMRLQLASALTLILYVIYNLSFDQAQVAANHGVAGLTQRILFVEIFAWFIAMARTARRASS